MFNPQFDESLRTQLDELFQLLPGVLSGDFSGYPAWFVNGTLFAFLEGNGVAVRLDRKDALVWLLDPGVKPFSLFDGKFRMTEWVQVFRDRFGRSLSDSCIWESAYNYALLRAGVEGGQDSQGEASGTQIVAI
jgi:hypothetical protein